MIIEVLTAFRAVKITWETLEILHLIHVGHLTGKASYKGIGAIHHVAQKKYQKQKDKKDPAQQLAREAKTLYDFQVTGNATQAILAIQDQAKTYLSELGNSIANLGQAKDYFLAIHTTLTKLVSALHDEDENEFSSQLLQFKSNFESFKTEFTQFLLSLKPPPRQLLYIASLSDTKLMELYNSHLTTIKAYTETLEETKKWIGTRFEENFTAIDGLPATQGVSVHALEQLLQDIKLSIQNTARLSETIHALLPNKTELAATCADITQISAAFKQSHQTTRPIPLEDDPHWFPLLTEAEQSVVGQRVFLHMMNVAKHNEDEKLELAQIFLRQHISKHELNQIETNRLAHEMASILRRWQSGKCEQLIQFLSPLMQGAILPNSDLDGLLEWLKAKRKIQSANALLTEVLVSPCCFKQCSIESGPAKFKRLLPENEDVIQQHLDKHWGTIWEKNDALIQLPESFKTTIYPKHRLEPDEQSPNFNLVSPVMQKLVAALIADLRQLKALLDDNRIHLNTQYNALNAKINEAAEAQKNQEHEAGVARIRKAHGYIYAINSSSNSLYPYLYHIKTINEADKQRQVPTRDDLLQIIYRGVDPNEVCSWTPSTTSDSQSMQLLNCFFPDQKEDSRTKAWIYACTDCQVNTLPIFAHLFSPTERPLAIESAPEPQTLCISSVKNNLSIQAILKDQTKKSSIATYSKALSGVTPKTIEETDTIFRELQNYYVLALVRVNPEYRHELPLMRQFECLVKNFFKFGQDIGEKRLTSVQIYIGDLCAVLSAKDIDSINKALDDLKNNYASRSQQEQRTTRSALYAIMKKAFEGPIAYIISKNNADHPNQFKLAEEKKELEAEVNSLKITIKKMEQDKAKTDTKHAQNITDLTVRLGAEHEQKIVNLTSQFEARQMQDKKEANAKHKQDIERLDAKYKQDIGRLDAKYKQDIETLDANHKQDIGRLDANHKQDITDLKTELEKKIDFIIEAFALEQPTATAEEHTPANPVRFFTQPAPSL
jgi:hypothetical protein